MTLKPRNVLLWPVVGLASRAYLTCLTTTKALLEIAVHVSLPLYFMLSSVVVVAQTLPATNHCVLLIIGTVSSVDDQGLLLHS